MQFFATVPLPHIHTMDVSKLFSESSFIGYASLEDRKLFVYKAVVVTPKKPVVQMTVIVAVNPRQHTRGHVKTAPGDAAT
ncbi:hypothetical protein CDAR_81881 [Caerostris darwini]|uniref:Uncharacterized protein n=1 Tax=Caerostris darwini TaxID=1538125 RepID=A0AAV4V615_9ARAC|nr:hypothetical protein CDAR_81881 [Caerostris darwini]